VTGTASAPFTQVLDGTCPDPAALGGKGAALDRLIGWGVRVPDTGVVTADAYRAIAAQPGPAALVAGLAAGEEFDVDEIDRVFAEARPCAAARAAMVELGRRIGAGHRLAVRSSATVEDLSDSSFAGLYRSVLDVDPNDSEALVGAISACSPRCGIRRRGPTVTRSGSTLGGPGPSHHHDGFLHR
jgi:phosphoenolpyruvate synthase/pyruvate phosphate dikinase